jgi:ATP-dependent Clp protease ATP-binding subunit ClpB
VTWQQELATSAGTSPHVVLTGNTLDHVVVADDDGVRALSTLAAVGEVAAANGVQVLVVVDPVLGFSLLRLQPDTDAPALPAPLAAMGEYDPAAKADGALHVSPEALQEVLAVAATVPGVVGVIVVDAARLVVDMRNLSEAEARLFTVAAALARRVELRNGGDGRVVYPPVYWLCRDGYELPPWYVSDPHVRTVNLPLPSREERTALAAGLTATDGVEVGRETHQMSVNAVRAVCRLVRRGTAVEEAATLVRLGVVEDRWNDDALRAQLGNGDKVLLERVVGQEIAVRRTWAALARAATGISGIHRPSSGRRPRMVLFFAGASGTGKTELAKALNDLVFGEDVPLIRIDMSGYTTEHSNQRLIGAPPGYVGYEAGGELTNAVRDQPFSVVLFDEFEKAHPKVLELFLQLLDEGHLDDGLGRRVYFDQTVVIFTSNLGVTEAVRTETGVQRRSVLTQKMGYDEIERTVVDGITRHFTEELGRTEILNRIGDNLIVFDLTRPEAAVEIFGLLMDNVYQGFTKVHDAKLELDPEVETRLREACCADLSLGGRGIANKVESLLLDPLGSWLFPHLGSLGDTVRITAWSDDDGYPVLEATHAASR